MRVRFAVTAAIIASFAICASSAGSAHAGERAHAVLRYAPDADIERCPTSAELADAVAARIGYDPFDGGTSEEKREVVVGVHRQQAGIVGVLELRGPQAGAKATRELSSPSGDCRELLDALAVAIAIGLDPGSLTRPPGDLPPAPPSAAPVAPVAAAPPPGASSPAAADRTSDARAPDDDRLDVRLGGGPLVMFGELPATAAALDVSIGVRWKWLEPTVEGFATLPTTLDAPPGRVTASLLGAGIVPCGHADLFFGCVGLTLGALRGEGEGVATPRRGSQFYSGASGRAGIEVAVSRSIWIRGYAEAVAPLTRITLQLAAQDVWRMPSVAARVGAAAGIRF